MVRQEVAQFHPVERDAKHGRDPVERAFERHHQAIAHHVHHRLRAQLHLTVGVDEGVPITLPSVDAIDPEAFRAPAEEHVAADPIACEQPSRRLPHRAEALQAQLQAQGQLFGTGVFLLFLRQQQGGFQVGEPCRHHQVIGGDLQLQRLGPLDVEKILVDQREDRNLPQIDLLPPGEVEQQIERTLPPVELEIERGILVRRCAGTIPFGFSRARFGLEQQAFAGHAWSLARSSSSSRLAISSPRSPAGSRRPASARSSRSRASPLIAGKSWANPVIS